MFWDVFFFFLNEDIFVILDGVWFVFMLLKYLEFEWKSWVEERFFWDICERMLFSFGGEGGGIWIVVWVEVLNGGL